MSARAFSLVTLVLGVAGGAVLAFFLLGRPLPAQAQEEIEPEPVCVQWQLAMFAANFPGYLNLDIREEESLAASSVILPEGWEPIDVEGGFAAIIPARRCVRYE